MASSKYKPTGLDGNVNFNIPDVNHPAIGTVAVSGRFRRIKPNCIRPEVDPTIINVMANKLTAWAGKCGFKSDHFERYPINIIAVNVIEFCVYCYPNVLLDSRQMEYFIVSSCWGFLFDDALEEAWFEGKLHRGNIQILRDIHATFLKIIRNQPIEDPLPEYPELPGYKLIIKCLQHAIELGIELAGDEGYQEALDPVVANLQMVLECNEWFTVSRLNERYSLGTYRSWRMINAAAHCILEASAFSDKVRLPHEIRNHPAFRQMVRIMMSYVQKANDVLGVKKDFEYKGGDPDNEIVFRVICKGDPIEVAVREACALIDEELADLILIKQALVDIFGEDENLLWYLDKVDNIIDGSNRVFIQNVRFRLERGFVQLTREDEN